VTWRALILFIAGVTLLSAVYGFTGTAPSHVAQLLFRMAPPLGAALWVEADARRLRRVPCYELGAFMFFGWPVAVPCYCLWSRGWRGWRVAFALLGLIMAPALIGGALTLFLHPDALLEGSFLP
jgi:hypothetical protein